MHTLFQGARQILGQFFAHVQAQVRVGLVQLGRRALHEIGSDGRGQSDADEAGEFLGAQRRQGADLVGVAQHALGDLDDAGACRRDHDARRRALDQLHAKALFQRLELLAERGLCGVGAFRRAAEVTRFGERDQIFQLPKVWHG